MMNNLFGSLRQSLERISSRRESIPDPDHPSVVRSNPGYMLLGHTDLSWSAIRPDELSQTANVPAPSSPYVFRAVKRDVTVHAGTINRGGRNIAYFHLTRGNGSTTITYVPQELLLQLHDDAANAIPAIRSLMA